MDRKTSGPKPKILPDEKERQKEIREAWKFGLGRDGKTKLRLPSRMRVSPSKYKPGKGKKLKNQPRCYNLGPISLSCKTCLWKSICKIEPFIPTFQDSTGDGV